MLFIAPVLLAVAVSALPNEHNAMIPRDRLAQMTVSEANDVCGAKQTVSCCNKSEKSADENNTKSNGVLSGLLDGVLGKDGLHVLDGECQPLSLNVVELVGINQLLNQQCSGKVACCDKTTQVNSNGLVNLGLPCIALGTLIG